MRWFHSLRASAGGLLLGLVLAAPAAGDEPRVHPDAASVQPLAVGSAVPSAQVLTVEGAPVDLADVVREHGALLVFYRGGW